MARITSNPKPGTVLRANWAGGDNAKMRLIRYIEHPAGNCWAVNIYDRHRHRFSKTEQFVDANEIARAIATELGRSPDEAGTARLAADLAK